MELLITFFIAIGLISSDNKNISQSEVLSIQQQYHEKLTAQYGEKYTSIIVGTNENERD